MFGLVSFLDRILKCSSEVYPDRKPSQKQKGARLPGEEG